MSNETDLDWLARNVHEWPAGDHQPWCYVYWKGGHRAVSGNCITVIQPCVRVEMSEWLARRAELQNKPSWEDAPEWADWLAQDDDKEWKYLGKNPMKYVDGWAADKIKAARSGEVLGDWRDTLEKRPEEFKPSIEEANRLAQEFKLLTGIEDNQEQDMKQDNKWFERGELPPVGTECEIDLGAKWRKAFVVGRNYTGRIVVEVDTCDFIVADGCTFRPIRTERDELLAVIVEEMNHYDTDGKLADAILAAGFSLRDK